MNINEICPCKRARMARKDAPAQQRHEARKERNIERAEAERVQDAIAKAARKAEAQRVKAQTDFGLETFS